MTENGNGNGALDRLTANRRRADLVSGLRGLRPGSSATPQAQAPAEALGRRERIGTDGHLVGDDDIGICDPGRDLVGTAPIMDRKPVRKIRGAKLRFR
jgi:hypothetical protein